VVAGTAETEGAQGAPAEKRSAFYADTALVRYRGASHVKVLKDSECIEEFATRPNAAYWKSIEVV
jgi:hypothetical protein